MSLDTRPQDRGVDLRRRPRRRTLLWLGVVVLVPVLFGLSLARTSKAENAPVLTVQSPAAAITVDAQSASQPLRVTLERTGFPLPGEEVMFYVSTRSGLDASWVSLSNMAVTTDGDGVATSTLQYGAERPLVPSSFMVTAMWKDLSVNWTLNYVPAATGP